MFTSWNSGLEFCPNSSGMACFCASSYSQRRFVFAPVQRTPQRLNHVFGTITKIPARVVTVMSSWLQVISNHVMPRFVFKQVLLIFFIFQRIDTSIYFNATLDNHFSYAAVLYTKFLSLRHSKRDPMSRHVTFHIKTGAVTPTNVTSSYVKSCFALHITARNVTSSYRGIRWFGGFTSSYGMSRCVFKRDCLGNFAVLRSQLINIYIYQKKKKNRCTTYNF